MYQLLGQLYTQCGKQACCKVQEQLAIAVTVCASPELLKNLGVSVPSCQSNALCYKQAL